jgi:membrane associated rhomboid family serine protease
MKIVRMVFAFVLAFFTFGLVGKGLAMALQIGGVLAVSNFTDSQEIFDDVGAAANILGLVGGLYVASRCYRWITRERHSDVAPTAVSQ